MNIQQRYAIEFCVKSELTFTQTLKKIQFAYKDEAAKKSCVHKWFVRFRDGEKLPQDHPHPSPVRSGRSRKNIDRVKAALEENPCSTIRVLAEKLHLCRGTVHKIVKVDLGLKKIASTYVPHRLTDEQKEERVRCAERFIAAADENPDFLTCIVTGDETWCFQYEPTSKRMTAQWCAKGDERPKKSRAARSQKVKTMLIAFFDAEGMIHHEFLPTGTTVTGNFYNSVMIRLRDRLNRERTLKYQSNKLAFLHDNAPSHGSNIVAKRLAKMKLTVIKHPPYSPDLAPADFFLFPQLKKVLRGKRFENVATIQRKVKRVLRKIPESRFKNAFESLYTRCCICVSNGGEYVEK
jgi:[histone H3]-lysine36 N-dimethyltransferase SETMAR